MDPYALIPAPRTLTVAVKTKSVATIIVGHSAWIQLTFLSTPSRKFALRLRWTGLLMPVYSRRDVAKTVEIVMVSDHAVQVTVEGYVATEMKGTKVQTLSVVHTLYVP